MTDRVGKSEAVAAVRAAAHTTTLEDGSPGRSTIHSFAHTTGGIALGADADLEQALEYVTQAVEIAWVDHPLRHDLAVRLSARRTLYLDVRRPV